jgi:SOS-response transcriptional repressor LexA
MGMNEREEFGKRLSQLLISKGYVSNYQSLQRQTHGIDVKPLSETLGLSTEIVRRYIRGLAIPRDPVLKSIAKWLNVSYQYLRDGEGEAIKSRIIKIPLLKWEQVASWKSGKKTSDFHVMEVTVNNLGNHIFALEIDSDSARPAFPPGTCVIFDPDTEPFHHALVIAADNKSQGTFFRELLIEGREKYLNPLNPDFPAEKITASTRIKGVFVAADFSKARFKS